MSDTIEVKNVANPRRPVDLEGGRMLAPGERGQAPDCAHTRDAIEAGLLVEISAKAQPSNLSRLKVDELRAMAAERGHAVPDDVTRADLIALIERGGEE